MILLNGVEQRIGNVLLAYYFVKGLGAIFSCGDDEIFHRGKYIKGFGWKMELLVIR